jgi:uncharacterized protein (DUF427 family)
MTGTGPLSKAPAGHFNFEPPPPGRTIYLEHTPKRIRVEVGGEVIADSRRAFMLHESGLQPMYYFPPEDVRTDVMTPTDRHTHCPKKGDASYYTIQAGGETVENGAWYYPAPLDDAPFIKDLIAFYFDRMGRWMEEGQEIGVHPRDPYHRVDVLKTDRHIRVSLDGELLAETSRAMALFETNLPVRWYMPAADVVTTLEPSDTVTRCPYKGAAAYYSVGDGEGGKDVIWYYDDPLDEVLGIKGLLCFFNERVDIELDGELQERPESPWSHRVKPVKQKAAAAARAHD